jgi:hypothetical protein
MGKENITSMSSNPIYDLSLQNISKRGIQTKSIKIHL